MYVYIMSSKSNKYTINGAKISLRNLNYKTSYLRWEATTQQQYS